MDPNDLMSMFFGGGGGGRQRQARTTKSMSHVVQASLKGIFAVHFL